MKRLFIDTETRSEIPLKRGVYRYREGKLARVIICAWAVNDEPVCVEDWLHGEPSAAFRQVFETADEIVAHNAQFDRPLLEIEGFFRPIETWRCTMAQAMSNSLPGGLGKLCAIMRVPLAQSKQHGGKNLIQLFCIPRKSKNEISIFNDGISHPIEWAAFLSYAGHDVEACRVLRQKLPRLNYSGIELASWHLDQKINDRGTYVDVDLARSAIRAADLEQARLRERTQAETFGLLESTTQRDKLLELILAWYGVTLPNCQAGTLERRLDDPDISEEVKELLRIRLMASKTTATKYKTCIECLCEDGRLHGLLAWAGALRTMRWAGRLFQPQNLMRTPKHLAKQMAFVIEAIKDGAVDLFFENVMEAVGAATRGVLCAAPGKKLVVADLSNIEGRMIAWLAGEEWKLRAFRYFDASIGHDLYMLTYSSSFGVPIEVVSADEEAGGRMRLIGKVCELALNYQGALGAFMSMGLAYGIVVYSTDAPPRWAHKKVCLSKSEVFKIVNAWRRANPAIVQFWADVQDAAIDAIQTPGVEVRTGRLVFRRDGPWLRIRLPSGHYLCYPHPQYGKQRVQCRDCGGVGKAASTVGENDKGEVEVIYDICQHCTGRGWNVDVVISYMGVNQYTRKWERLHTYGGKLAENITQASARDVLRDGMLDAEVACYAVCLSVHDELITEVDDTDEWSVDALTEIMSQSRAWCPGLPLAAKGYEAQRYRKG